MLATLLGAVPIKITALHTRAFHNFRTAVLTHAENYWINKRRKLLLKVLAGRKLLLRQEGKKLNKEYESLDWEENKKVQQENENRE